MKAAEMKGLRMCEAACREFVARCADGRARSIVSKAAMKRALAVVDAAREGK